MEVLYSYAHVIHLILAIMFLGFVFTDIAVLSALNGKLDKDTKKKINQALGKRSFRIFPLSLLFLILTGGIMLSRYMNSTVGYLDNNLQKILTFKIFLVLLIAIGVGYNMYIKFSGKTKIHFMQHHFHKLVFVLGFFIILAAKLMFIL